MTWNYRVMRQCADTEDEYLEIVEAFYDEEGKFRGWAPANIMSTEGTHGLRWILDRMAEALDKPLLTGPTDN